MGRLVKLKRLLLYYNVKEHNKNSIFYISKAKRSNMGLTAIIPALRQRQKNHEFKTSLGCNVYYT